LIIKLGAQWRGNYHEAIRRYKICDVYRLVDFRFVVMSQKNKLHLNIERIDSYLTTQSRIRQEQLIKVVKSM